MIGLCSRTARHMRGLLVNSGDARVRLSVKGGGCSGFQYEITTESTPLEAPDEDLTVRDVPLRVCGKSMLYLIGTQITWVANTQGSRMEFTNPNAASSCGCGETFSVSQDPHTKSEEIFLNPVDSPRQDERDELYDHRAHRWKVILRPLFTAYLERHGHLDVPSKEPIIGSVRQSGTYRDEFDAAFPEFREGSSGNADEAAPVYTWLDPNKELDEIGMKYSSSVFDAFIRTCNGRVTAAQIHEEFGVDASLFARLMDERILPNDCTFVSTHGRIHKAGEVYVFPKFGSNVCSYCLK